MKIAYLVDTDWVIDHFNKVEKITQKLDELKPSGIAISVISLAELYEGICHSNNPQKSHKVLDTFLQDFSIMGLDEEICKVFGMERGKLRKKKKLIGDFDLLIASTCIYHNITLLSNNQKHFKMVEGLNIISLS